MNMVLCPVTTIADHVTIGTEKNNQKGASHTRLNDK
jgi:hypothetical protein